MRITCPTCAAEYDVPGTLAPGRAVKCARCGSKWAPVAPLPPPAPTPPPDTEPLPPVVPIPPLSRPAAIPLAVPVTRPAPRRLALLLAWAASVLILAGLAAAAVVWRGPVMAAWPPSVRAYGALGLTGHP